MSNPLIHWVLIVDFEVGDFAMFLDPDWIPIGVLQLRAAA